MARRSEGPWFWEDRGEYYATIAGKRTRLNTADKEEATRRWHALMAQTNIGQTQEDTPFVVLADSFLTHSQEHDSPKTYRAYRYFLQVFSDALKGQSRPKSLTVREMKPFHVEDVVRWQKGRAERGERDERNRPYRAWGQSSRGSFIRCVQACLNWGVKQGVIPSNPLRGRIDSPPAVSRGAEAVISEDEYAKLLDCANSSFRLFLTAIRHTGTRPHLVAAVTSANFDERAGCWLFREHKTAGVTGEPQIVHLTATMIELTKRLIAQRGEGIPLFVNAKNNPWTDSAWGKAMAATRAKVKAKYGVEIAAVAYGFRHTFATDHLSRGVPDALVATMLGHKGTAMIHKNYSHLSARQQAVKAHLNVTPTDAELKALGVVVETAVTLQAVELAVSGSGGNVPVAV